MLISSQLQASAQHPQLGEWWCLPDANEIVDEHLVDAMIRETDRAIDDWQIRWEEYMKCRKCAHLQAMELLLICGLDERGTLLEYHARYTRFCITSYAVKHVRNLPQGLTSLQRQQIQRCVACASHVLEWPISRGPIQKDKLRYVDDSAVISMFSLLSCLTHCQRAELRQNVFRTTTRSSARKLQKRHSGSRPLLDTC
jgi:hypothetical protein